MSTASCYTDRSGGSTSGVVHRAQRAETRPAVPPPPMSAIPRPTVANPAATHQYDAAVAKVVSLDPFQIHELEDASYELWLFDGDMALVKDVFEDYGVEANGYGWEALADSLVDSEFPDLADLISFCSEGGTFVAGSTDLAALQRLVVLLHAAFHDRSLLARLIREAGID